MRSYTEIYKEYEYIMNGDHLDQEMKDERLVELMDEIMGYFIRDPEEGKQLGKYNSLYRMISNSRSKKKQPIH